jgi:hypothetical protein
MTIIKNKTFDKEREFYESDGVCLQNCTFDGEADGESAFKESKNVSVEGCLWNLRYPFWHDDGVMIKDTHLTEKCRAALWYSKNIRVENSKLHGIKALRECADVEIKNTSIDSPEFGWSTDRVKMTDSTAKGEYFMFRASNLELEGFELNGKYSFQYVDGAVFENCTLNTKDAFWHAKNVTVRNSIVNGEYLAWYSENITFENCKIKGTQPLCYCKGLKLINCEMIDADLSFEKSEVEATLTAPIVSIKNAASGHVSVPAVGELIKTDPRAECVVEIG